MSELNKIQRLIKEEVADLICDTHPNCCNLRDNNLPRLEQMIMDEIANANEPISVQTAIANIEMEYNDILFDQDLD